MEPNKILSANILDLVFDGRNKEYGAYELRVTYPQRIKRSLIVVFFIAGTAIAGAALASSFKGDTDKRIAYKEMTLEEITPEEKKPEPVPEQPKPETPPPVQTERLTEFNVVPDEKADEPPPTQEDIKVAEIGLTKQEGVVDEGLAQTNDIDDKKGIIEAKEEDDPNKVWPVVQVPAHFEGDWIRFLTRNLNANVPVDNGAPSGRYTVLIQFVVDKEGNLSDITPLTTIGYGMEQEAVRVLKRAKGWKPGIQNGHEVKSYHKQPVTFIVEEQ